MLLPFRGFAPKESCPSQGANSDSNRIPSIAGASSERAIVTAGSAFCLSGLKFRNHSPINREVILTDNRDTRPCVSTSKPNFILTARNFQPSLCRINLNYHEKYQKCQYITCTIKNYSIFLVLSTEPVTIRFLLIIFVLSLIVTLGGTDNFKQVHLKICSQPDKTVLVPTKNPVDTGSTTIVPEKKLIVPGKMLVVPEKRFIVPDQMLIVPEKIWVVPGKTLTVPNKRLIVPIKMPIVPV